MSTQSETTDEANEATEEKRTRQEIEEETGGVVYTEHGRRYRAQVISNSGDRDAPTSV